MYKTKTLRKIVVSIVIFSMMAVYGAVPTVKAATLKDAKDTLSTSAPGVLATSTVTFETLLAIPATGYIEVTLPGDFGDIVSGSCSNGGSGATTSAEIYRCLYTSQLDATTTNSIQIVASNPSGTGSKHIYINTKTVGDVEIENADIMVAIVDTVSMTATVSATLTFTVAGTSTGVTINGVATTATSTATTTPFGTLTSAANSTVGQTLSASTNATGGFTVTAEQSGDLATAGGADINAFVDGLASTTPQTWTTPTANLASSTTYGHMGLTTDDTLNMSADYSSSKYVGFNGSNPVVVLNHNGPADGTTQSKGRANVAYTVRISDLQEAGEYSTTITYICTPTY